MAYFFIRRVTVDHRIHVTSRDPKEEVRLTQHHQGVLAAPIRLGNHPDPKSLGLQESSNHRHTETGVIDVGIAADDDDVTAVPA